MKISSIADPLKGEKLADIVPAPAPFVSDDNRIARLNLFPGRNLTADALQREQAVRVWPVERRGQAVTPGVIGGLEVALVGNTAVQVSPGQALCVSGIDLTIDRTLTIQIGDLRFYDPATKVFSDFLSTMEAPEPAEFVAVLVLQPGYVRDTDLPLNAQVEDDGTDFTPCERVPEDEVFYRTTTSDAVRAVLCRWPDAPAFGPAWRNRVAWTVFDAERQGKTLPWLGLGAPLAIIGFDTNRRPVGLDRYSVVREGGHPHARILLENTGEPRLWQAQFDQFSNQLTDLASLEPATANFASLPPVGVLPKVYVDLNRSEAVPPTWNAAQRFFPANYLVQMAVAPLEQLDTLVEACRSLQPYRLDQPDSVNLLLPVSQQWFDPNLLNIDVPAPEFQQAIDDLKAHRGDKLAARLDLRNRLSALNQAAAGQPLTFPDPDPKQLETPEPPVSAPPLPDAQYGTTRAGETFDGATYSSDPYEAFKAGAVNTLKKFTPADLDEFDALLKDTTLADADRNELKAYIEKQSEVQAEEAAKLSSLGLSDLIAYLQAKADAADELIDSGFLKARTDVYRLSQLLTNNALGTQFVASPSLSNIIERRAGLTDSSSVNLYASQLLANFAPTAVKTTTSSTVTPAPKVAKPNLRASAPKLSKVITNEINIGTFVKYDPTGGVLNDVVNTGTVAAAGKSNLDAVQQIINNSGLTADQKKAFTDLRASADKLATPEGKAGLAEIGAIGDFASSYVENFNSLSQKQIRTIPLDRLQPALAPQVRQDIHEGRLDIFERLARLNISLADLTTDFVDTTTPADPATPPPAPFRLTFQRLIMRRQFDVISTIDATTNTVIDADESKHFSSGVKYSDMSVAALRAVEKRVTDYRNLVANAQAVLAQIRGFSSAVQGALNQTDDELDEARHDVAVAEALLQEEQLRLDGINAHRAQILNEHVEFVVFHRPRAVSFRQDAPVRVIEPALTSNPIPDCLKEDLVLPPDLATLRETFRGAPVKWFSQSAGWLNAIDRWDHMRSFLERVALRADTNVFTIDSGAAASSGRYTGAIGNVFNTRIQIAQRYTARAGEIEVSTLPALSWIDLRGKAQAILTLGHLIDTAPPNVASLAAQELTDVFKVAACLHRDFSQVPALVRLAWAERYSQFDGPADFRDLSKLPRWQQVEFTLRREMQMDTDWLFSRIDQTQSEAVDLINDLIRVCLLLASHAPVDQLITGSVVETVNPILGSLLKLRIDPIRVHVGMEAVFESASAGIVKATIQDIGSGQAVARVTTAPSIAITLQANTSMRLQEAMTFATR